MIRYTQGNLLESGAQALVNTVNTVGVMGKGIALMFKDAYKENFLEYTAACKAKEVRTGQVFVTETRQLSGPQWIVNFPTKQHWRAPSRMERIVDGLADLRRLLVDHHVQSIAIPPLGAGNGGLDGPPCASRLNMRWATCPTWTSWCTSPPPSTRTWPSAPVCRS